MGMLLKVKNAARTAHEERELPVEFLAAVDAVALLDIPDDSPLLATLLQQLEEYDPYAGCGCFGSGATPADLRSTLARLGITAPSPPPAV
jgi:deoxycytidine triphosphate deaminase